MPRLTALGTGARRRAGENGVVGGMMAVRKHPAAAAKISLGWTHGGRRRNAVCFDAG
jgi:hypothetical protein